MSKTLKVAGGHYTIVDDDDYIWLKHFSIFLSGKGNYPTIQFKINVNGKLKYCRHRVHRLINNTPIGKQTDHINGLHYDNRKYNLRTVTSRQNIANNIIPRNNKILPGVFIHIKPSGRIKYRSKIVIDGIAKSLGYYDTQEEAHQAYIKEKNRVKEKLFQSPNIPAMI